MVYILVGYMQTFFFQLHVVIKSILRISLCNLDHSFSVRTYRHVPPHAYTQDRVFKEILSKSDNF